MLNVKSKRAEARHKTFSCSARECDLNALLNKYKKKCCLLHKTLCVYIRQIVMLVEFFTQQLRIGASSLMPRCVNRKVSNFFSLVFFYDSNIYNLWFVITNKQWRMFCLFEVLSVDYTRRRYMWVIKSGCCVRSDGIYMRAYIYFLLVFSYHSNVEIKRAHHNSMRTTSERIGGWEQVEWEMRDFQILFERL